MAKIIYIDMDDTIADFIGSYRAALQFNPAIKHPQSQHRFFADLEPISGAIEAVEKLIASPLYDPYILSAPSTRNPFSYAEKREWVEKHFGLEFCKKLILCPNKALLKGDILIDDNNRGKGQDQFEGELIHFGSERYPDWESVLSLLKL